jgi:outer membrane protein assembly factor BamB
MYDTTLGESIVYALNDKGHLAAYNASTGTVVWQASVGGGTEATPTVYEGTVYVGNVNGTLTALNATTGAVDCKFVLPIVAPETIPGRIQATPVVGDVDGTGPTVFFGDEGQTENVIAGHFWAITGVGNSAGACQRRWMFDDWNNTGTAGDRTGSWDEPALVKDSTGRWVVIFGSSNPDDSVYDLDAVTGTELWRFQTSVSNSDADVGGGPTVTPPGTNGSAHGRVYVAGKDRRVYALDLLTGRKIWTQNLQQTPALESDEIEIPGLAAGKLYVGFAGYLFAFTASTGQLRYQTPSVGKSFLSSPTISSAPGNRALFLGDVAGGEDAFALSSGKELLSINTGSGIDDSAAVSDGVLYFGDNSGTIYAYAPTAP